MKTRLNILCYMTMILLGIYLSAYQNILSTISQSYSINAAAVGILISLHFIGSLTAPLIFGEISDRTGKKSVVIISFCIMISGLAAIFLSNGILMVAIGIFLIGNGFAVTEGVLTGVLADENIGEAGRVISMSQVFFCVGAVAGPLAALLTERVSGSWKTIFLLLIVLFAVLLTNFARITINKGKPSKDSGTGSKLISVKLFKEKAFVMLCISMFIYVGIEEGVAFWLNTYFESSYELKALGSYVLSIYWSGMIVGRYLASRFSSKNTLFLKAGLLISLLFITVPLIWRSEAIGIICFFGVGLGFSAVWPVLMSIIANRYPEYTGTAMGAMMTAGAGGGVAVPFLMGVIANFTAISAAFWVIPVSVILILILQSRA